MTIGSGIRDGGGMKITLNNAIVDAQSRDASIISELAHRTFRQTYAERTAPEDMDAFLADAYRTEDIEERLGDPRHRFLLATSEDLVVGFAHLITDARDPSVSGRLPVLLAEIYLDREHQGIGLGGALMARAIGVARDSGADVLWLGVWEHNTRAIEFYHRQGFIPVGEMAFAFGSEQQRDIVMALPL